MNGLFFHKWSHLVMFFGSITLQLCDFYRACLGIDLRFMKHNGMMQNWNLSESCGHHSEVASHFPEYLLYITWKHSFLKFLRHRQVKRISQTDTYINMVLVVYSVGIALLLMWRFWRPFVSSQSKNHSQNFLKHLKTKD